MLKGRVSTIDEEFEKGGEAPKLTKEEASEWLNLKIMNKAKDCLRYPSKDQKVTLDAITNRVYEGFVEDWGYNETVLNAMRTLKANRAYIMGVIEVLFDEDGDPIQPVKEEGSSDVKQSEAPAVGYSDDGRASPYYTASLMSIDEAHEALEKAKVYDPAAVAASIGRKKYGASKMAEMAAAGRKREKKPKGKARSRLGGGGRFAKLEHEIASGSKKK